MSCDVIKKGAKREIFSSHPHLLSKLEVSSYNYPVQIERGLSTAVPYWTGMESVNGYVLQPRSSTVKVKFSVSRTICHQQPI